MADIIEAIDTVIGCQHYGRPLSGNGPSGDFCNEDCQWCWHASRADTPPTPIIETPGEAIGIDQEQFITACRAGITDMGRRLLQPHPEISYYDWTTENWRGYTADLVIVDEAYSWVTHPPPMEPVTPRGLTLTGTTEADTLPEDPKARALRLQRYQNTGPKQTQWPRRGRR